MSYIYLASPYTHPNGAVRYNRYIAVRDELVAMTLRGDTVYSPIVNWHEVTRTYDLPHDWKWWRNHNESMLKPAALLRVLCLPGYDESKGVLHEVAYAQVHNIPVQHYMPESKSPALMELEHST